VQDTPTIETAAPEVDAVDMLTAQHRQLEKLFKAVLATDDARQRRQRLTPAADELMVHLGSEEAVFYPAVRAAGTEDVLLESLEEHLSLKRLLADLLALGAGEKTFEAKCKVLFEQTEHHHEEEEENLFPKVRKLLSLARRRELGRAMQQHQVQLLAERRPRDAVKSQTDEAEPLD
jgi:hemerythrin superfamily protein